MTGSPPQVLGPGAPAPSLPPVPPREQVERLVAASARTHGHLCPGQVIGVRMAILGLGLLGYSCPLPYPEIKNLVGVVEIERCLSDAVASASGLRFGRGSLKLVNLGLLAATFWDLANRRGVRLLSLEQARRLAPAYAPQIQGEHAQQTEAYKIMPSQELFRAQWVALTLPTQEMPGPRPPKVPCDRCGVPVRSGQVRRYGEENLCAVCAGEAYFNPLEPLEL